MCVVDSEHRSGARASVTSAERAAPAGRPALVRPRSSRLAHLWANRARKGVRLLHRAV
jgi:hypothetical protein